MYIIFEIVVVVEVHAVLEWRIPVSVYMCLFGRIVIEHKCWHRFAQHAYDMLLT